MVEVDNNGLFEALVQDYEALLDEYREFTKSVSQKLLFSSEVSTALYFAQSLEYLYELHEYFRRFYALLDAAPYNVERRSQVDKWIADVHPDVHLCVAAYRESDADLQSAVVAHLEDKPAVLAWAQGYNNRAEEKLRVKTVEPESVVDGERRALIEMNVRRDYQTHVVGEWEELKQKHAECVTLVRQHFGFNFGLGLRSSCELEFVDGIERLSQSCLVFEPVQQLIDRLNRCAALTRQCLGVIDNAELKSNMDRTLMLLLIMTAKLSEAASQLHQAMGNFSLKYERYKEALSEQLKAFMQPWLELDHPNPISESIAAYKRFVVEKPKKVLFV